MTGERALEILRETGALLQGHFELRSGLHSASFFQCAQALRFPQQAAALCDGLAGAVLAGLPDTQVDAVIAPAMGGIVVGYELARALGVRSIFAEKENGALVLRRGFRIAPGERFLVAEDVVTRGGRVAETIDIVSSRGGRCLAVAVVVDRSGGAADFPCPSFSLVQMTPETYEPAACPLCKQGLPLEHPGS